MGTMESTVNDALAGLLRETRKVWRESDIVNSERTGMLKGSSKRPDILVIEPNISPVVIETEFLPATNAETEAKARLGEQLRHDGRKILSCIALRLPKRLQSKHGLELKNELSQAQDIEMALYTGSSPLNAMRFPSFGWISGTIADLSILIQDASIPPDVIDEAANILVGGVSEAAELLDQMVATHPDVNHFISGMLHQKDSPQTRRMATTILANAFMFHESLVGLSGEFGQVYSLEQLENSREGLNNSTILKEWRKIRTINYWAIFDIASEILATIPTQHSKDFVDRLADTAKKLLRNNLMRSHDLMGAVFQRLIVDRKFLAAYYTTPASASLLVGLAIRPNKLLSGGNWSSEYDLTNLKVADFACGTGTLLSTAYHRMSQLHEVAGGDSEAIHPKMMASVLVGCDVLPAATHLTASMLSGAHPTIKYEGSSILHVAYGKQENEIIALGSLDLLDSQGKLPFHSSTSKSLDSTGETKKDTWLTFSDQYFDMVIMNPPFTRNTGHEGKKIGVPNPMFAAFEFSTDVQQKMSKALERLTKGKGTCADGNAGEASIFLALADKKLKQNGILALIMPLSLISGEAWSKSRTLLYNNYSNLIVASIIGDNTDSDDDISDISFSADTGMGECIIVAQKSMTLNKRAIFVTLNQKPNYPLIGATIAEKVNKCIENNTIRALEDGPLGGTPLYFGDDIVGYILDAPISASSGWNIARIADIQLAQTAYQLVHGNRIWLPRMNKSEAFNITTTTIMVIGQIGPYHSDVEGKTKNGGVRGPFQKIKLNSKSVPTYPILWGHDAKQERTFMFGADFEGLPIRGSSIVEQTMIDRKIESIWKTASYCHFNQNFRFNSQSTAMQFTPERTIGGRAWISIQLSSVEQEKALVLWGNTSLGLLLHWWHSNKQQSGRGNIGKTALQNLPVLDVTALTADQLAEAGKLFDEFCEKPLMPVHEMVNDPIRKALDEQFITRVLGLPASLFVPLELLRQKLSHEPSIRGGKK